MKKRFITLILSVVLCFTALYGFAGCTATGPFTVTFEPCREGAILAREYHENRIEDRENIFEIEYVDDGKVYEEDWERPVKWVKQTVNNASEIIEPIFLHESAWHDGWSKSIRRLTSSTKVGATWDEHAFTVTFEPGAYDATLVSGHENRLRQEVLSPLNIKYPEWTRVGYTMDEAWSWSKYSTSDINGNCTLTPEWRANTYTISFVDEIEENVYEEICESKQVTYGKPIGEMPVPVKDGETFGAWKVQGEHTFIFGDKVYDYTQNLTLQAVWVGSDVGLIEYEDVGGAYSGNVTYKYGQETPLTTPQKTGYTFVGWSGTGIGDGVNDKVLTYTIPADTLDAKLKFKAHWTAKEYTVHFNAGSGATLETDSKQVLFGNELGDLPVPQKDGYEFAGWFYNNVTVNEQTVWDIDSNSVELVAQYVRIYTIYYELKCLVRGTQVTCKFDNSVNLESFGLVKESDYLYKLENVKEGSLLPPFPSVKTENSDEYGFSSWKFGKTDTKKGVTVSAGTMINESNFKGTYETGIIKLTVHCYSFWTPFY
ncbi:MAG: InlB B-repeat-containing protein [Clostridia bacterium]|nr:InlB B-repeat-containing protein [Clostridia bacterium]